MSNRSFRVSQADLKKLECSKELPEQEIKLVRNY
jgi:hypothetical protein